jgi:hypothetical protein
MNVSPPEPAAPETSEHDVGVLGLGYVGLPTAAVLATNGRTRRWFRPPA